jgi:hypothetical protein
LRRQRRGHFTREFARRVRAHSVGDDEKMPARLPKSRRRRRFRRKGILIIRPAHSNVGARRNDKRIPPPLFVFIVHTIDLKKRANRSLKRKDKN